MFDQSFKEEPSQLMGGPFVMAPTLGLDLGLAV